MLKFVFEKNLFFPFEQRRELNCSILVPRKHFSLGGGELGGRPIVSHKGGELVGHLVVSLRKVKSGAFLILFSF